MKSNLTQLTDNELARILRQNSKESEAAFKELFRRYSSMVNAYVVKVLNHLPEAEDIFQETFIRFYKNVKSDLNNENIPGFLMRIARNLCLNFKRDQKTYVPIEEFHSIMEPNPTYDKKELLELITRSLDLLDYEYREAFVLREYDDLPYEQIAEICGITVANAKSRVFRAKSRIKEILAPYLRDLTNN